MAGLVIILMAVLVALFAYWIAPDASPQANRMMVEIAGRKPGFRMDFMLLDKTPPPSPTGWLERTLHGIPDRQVYIPVSSLPERIGDSLVVRRFLDEGVSERMALPAS